MKLISYFVVLPLVCVPTFLVAADLTTVLKKDRSLFCGIQSYDAALETSCAWSAAARAAGNCDMLQYQEVVGRRAIFKECLTLFVLGEGGTLPQSPPQKISAEGKKIWRLLRAVQPVAVAAQKVAEPACFSAIKPYPLRTSKNDHVQFFSCMEEREASILMNVNQSVTGKIVQEVQSILIKANVNDAETMLAIDQITLELEDNGAKTDLSTIREIASRIR